MWMTNCVSIEVLCIDEHLVSVAYRGMMRGLLVKCNNGYNEVPALTCIQSTRKGQFWKWCLWLGLWFAIMVLQNNNFRNIADSHSTLFNLFQSSTKLKRKTGMVIAWVLKLWSWGVFVWLLAYTTNSAQLPSIKAKTRIAAFKLIFEFYKQNSSSYDVWWWEGSRRGHSPGFSFGNILHEEVGNIFTFIPGHDLFPPGQS